jgi:very-short-patch-repair endonuclease
MPPWSNAPPDDFVAPSVRLVIEVDGGYHADRAAADARRDRALGRFGFR